LDEIKPDNVLTKKKTLTMFIHESSVHLSRWFCKIVLCPTQILTNKKSVALLVYLTRWEDSIPIF